jgi:hypothetical protein
MQRDTLTEDMSFSILKTVRVLLAFALSFWVAGAGCLLGCEGMMTASASESSAVTHHATSDLNLVVSGDACASGKSHDCCAKRNHSAQPKAQPTGKRTVIAAKKGVGETSAATTAAQTNLPTPSLFEQPAPLASRVRLPNRGHTYLRCCSFLI